MDSIVRGSAILCARFASSTIARSAAHVNCILLLILVLDRYENVLRARRRLGEKEIATFLFVINIVYCCTTAR